MITEEKMAEHLQGLHISPDFTSHSTPTLEDYSSDSVSMESDSSSSSTDCPFTIPSTQDLEQKLRNAQRITICEQIRKLQNEPVIPQVRLFFVTALFYAGILFDCQLLLSAGNTESI